MSRKRKNLDQPISVRCPDKQVLQRCDKRGRLTNWRTITDEKEKYQAYLCSREWAEKRKAVRNRANGLCERCRALPMAAVHHLTYARKYDELLEDLQAICQPCHDFTHGKDWFDPKPYSDVIQWLVGCHKDKPPMPFDLFSDLRNSSELEFPCDQMFAGAAILYTIGMRDAAEILLTQLPFDVSLLWFTLGWKHCRPQDIDRCYSVAGWHGNLSSEYWSCDTEQVEP